MRRVIGVAMESVHDFYKPRRERFTETPVFDGQFSNLCYQNRMTEGLEDFRKRAIDAGLFGEGKFPALSERWARMIFHLPYAFHAKRMYVEQFIVERKAKGVWEKDQQKFNFPQLETMRFEDKKAYGKAYAGFLKAVSESSMYQRFVKEKLEKAQRASQETGNLYTASIFLALMSTLESDFIEKTPLDKKRIGFVAYGSGSKAKVFEGIVQPGWEAVVRHFQVFKKLKNRQEIDYDQYEALHNNTLEAPVFTEKGRWALDHIGAEGVTLGARYYTAQLS